MLSGSQIAGFFTVKKAGNEINFLHSDQYQCFQQVDTTVFGGCGCACLGMPKLYRIANLRFLRSS